MTPVFRHGRLRLYLLRLLDEEPRHGYEVIRLLRDRFMGVYAPSPGTIYPRLARLEEEGLVTHDEENGRKVYRITEAGREELRSRGAELDELEAELSASVSDIVREVREDVRDTVRTLREELTRAAREMRGTERDQTRQARDTAREAAEAAREQARQAKETAWAQARQAKEQARQAKDEAYSHARRIREEAREQQRAGAWGNWSDWSRWGEWAGRTGWTGEHDMGALRDFEHLARDFVTDLRSVAWESGTILGSDVVPTLRDILADTLDRIRTEVFDLQRDEQERARRDSATEPTAPPAPADPEPGGHTEPPASWVPPEPPGSPAPPEPPAPPAPADPEPPHPAH